MPKERIVNFQVGSDHLVALSCCGKVLTAPLSLRGNWLGQLGRESQELLPVKSYTNQHFLSLSQKEQQQRESFSHFTDLEKSIKILNDQGTKPPNARIESNQPDNTPLEQLNLVQVDGERDDAPWRGRKIIELAVGDDHTILRDERGMVYGFGSNEQLQLGLGPFDQEKRIIKRPVRIDSITTPVDQIASGGNSSYFITNNRSLALSCGNGQFGQLGTGRFIHVNGEPTPIKVISNRSFFDESSKTLKSIPIHSINAGKTHAGVIFDTFNNSNSNSDSNSNIAFPIDRQVGYDVYLWGMNSNHQLGNGTRSNSPIPSPVKAIPQPLVETDDGDVINSQNYFKLIGDELQIKANQSDGSPSLDIYCGPHITVLY